MWPGKDLHIAFTWSPCLEALFYTLSRCSQSFGCWNGGRKILVSYLAENGAATSSNTRWSSVDKSNKKMLIPFVFLTATLPNVALQMLCTTVLLSIVLLHCYSFKFRSNRWSLLLDSWIYILRLFYSKTCVDFGWRLLSYHIVAKMEHCSDFSQPLKVKWISCFFKIGKARSLIFLFIKAGFLPHGRTMMKA